MIISGLFTFTDQKFGVSEIFLFYFISRNEFTHILRGFFKLIKRESKDIYNVRKDFYNKSCSIHQRILKYITVPLKKKL